MAEKVSTVRKAQAAQLLARGHTQVDVCSRTGISASYLSELIAHDAGFKEAAMSEVQNPHNPVHQRIDASLDELEEKVLKGIKDNFEFFNKPQYLIALQKNLNSSKRRYDDSQSESKNDDQVNVVVNIELPMFLVDQMKTIEAVKNTDNEVVEIGGRSMITANSNSLIEEANREIHTEVKEVPQIEANFGLSQKDFEDVKL